MKKIVKSFVLPALASRPVSALATRLLGHGIPVFMLHRMRTDAHPNRGGITPEHLRRTLRYLVENGYEFISLEELVNALTSQKPLPPRAVVFTMDDGYLDQAEVAAPIFLEYNCPVTFFVITGLLDQVLWPWDAKVSWVIEATEVPQITTVINEQKIQLDLGSAESRRSAKHQVQDLIRAAWGEDVPEIIERFAHDADVSVPERAPDLFRPMTWDMARRLEHQGIRFAPHSVTHTTMSRLSPESLDGEIRGAWEMLEQNLSRPLKIFCYPTGRTLDFGMREILALKRNTFLGAVSAVPAFVDKHYRMEHSLFSLPRLAMPDNMDDFIQYCSWIGYARLRYYGSISPRRETPSSHARTANGQTLQS